jgi:hypothetical protein
MSSRSRPPTDEHKTSIYDSRSGTPRPKAPTRRGHESSAIALPEIEHATPTQIDPLPHNRSEPLRVISMKTPADLVAARNEGRPAPEARQAREHRPQLRSLGDVMQRNSAPVHGTGNLAPPRDPKEVRGRKLRDLVIWGSVVVMLGCAVMLAVWFIAR